MSSVIYQKGSNVQLSDHFNLREFDCPCPQCTTTQVDPQLIVNLEAIRTKAGPLKINSGYRCPSHQSELRMAGYPTAVGPSTHSEGRAADITGADLQYSGATLEAFAREAGFMAVGVAPNWIHADLRNDKVRRWTYAR